MFCSRPLPTKPTKANGVPAIWMAIATKTSLLLKHSYGRTHFRRAFLGETPPRHFDTCQSDIGPDLPTLRGGPSLQLRQPAAATRKTQHLRKAVPYEWHSVTAYSMSALLQVTDCVIAASTAIGFWRLQAVRKTLHRLMTSSASLSLGTRSIRL